MAKDTLAIDVVDMTVRPGFKINIAIINQPNPVYNYVATVDQIRYLIQIPKYYVTDSLTKQPIDGRNFYEYFPDMNPYGGATQSEIDELTNKVSDLDERVTEIDVSKLSVTEYEKNTEYPRGRIVYVDPGQLYQANQDFTSNNDLGKTVKESFMSDISAGYLDAVTDAEIGDLGQRVEVLEEKIIDAEEVEFYDSISEFPQTGAVDIIYVDNTTGKSYTWNTTTSEYDIMNTNNIIPGSVFRCTL